MRAWDDGGEVGRASHSTRHDASANKVTWAKSALLASENANAMLLPLPPPPLPAAKPTSLPPKARATTTLEPGNVTRVPGCPSTGALLPLPLLLAASTDTLLPLPSHKPPKHAWRPPKTTARPPLLDAAAAPAAARSSSSSSRGAGPAVFLVVAAA